jgi:hypothetical protein
VLHYSTLDEYYKKLETKNYGYPLFRGDFLPEIEDPGRWGDDKNSIEYWSGFYSSKPVYKQLIRDVFKSMRVTGAFLGYV